MIFDHLVGLENVGSDLASQAIHFLAVLAVDLACFLSCSIWSSFAFNMFKAICRLRPWLRSA